MAVVSLKNKVKSRSMLAGNPQGTAPLPGYSLWLDASDASTFSFSSGNVVSEWRDKSPNGYHFTNSTVASQPTRDQTQNGKSGVRFFNDFLKNSSLNWAGSAFTVFMVVKYDTSWSAFSGLLGSQESGNERPTLGIDNSDFYAVFRTGISSASYNLGATGTNADVAVWRSAGVSAGSITVSFWRNNTAASANATITCLTPSAATLGASNAATNVDPALNADIFEVVIYPSQLSTSDREAVQNYLKGKWATP